MQAADVEKVDLHGCIGNGGRCNHIYRPADQRRACSECAHSSFKANSTTPNEVVYYYFPLRPRLQALLKSESFLRLLQVRPACITRRAKINKALTWLPDSMCFTYTFFWLCARKKLCKAFKMSWPGWEPPRTGVFRTDLENQDPQNLAACTRLCGFMMLRALIIIFLSN